MVLDFRYSVDFFSFHFPLVGLQQLRSNLKGLLLLFLLLLRFPPPHLLSRLRKKKNMRAIPNEVTKSQRQEGRSKRERMGRKKKVIEYSAKVCKSQKRANGRRCQCCSSSSSSSSSSSMNAIINGLCNSILCILGLFTHLLIFLSVDQLTVLDHPLPPRVDRSPPKKSTSRSPVGIREENKNEQSKQTIWAFFDNFDTISVSTGVL